MQRLGADCKRDYFGAACSSGYRSMAEVRNIVLHSTEGGTADSIARYLKTRPDGSAHIVVDGKACYRLLSDLTIPCAAPGANETGFHIEIVGYAHWTRAQWLFHPIMLHRVAMKMAQAAKRFRIPLDVVGPEKLRAGVRGVTTHADVSEAFNRSTHWDPGPGFPLYAVTLWARGYRKLMGK